MSDDPYYESEIAAEIPDLCKQLDEKVPGWAEKIDVEHLSMLNPKRCVMAQLFPERRYYISLQELGFESEKPWANHDEVWKEEILKRIS